MKETVEIIEVVKEAIAAKKGSQIIDLDLRGKSSFTDFFVIASGSNAPQIRAICENVEDELEEMGVFVSRIEGRDDAHWILMDYGDFMVHIFNEEDRSYYNLERLWTGGEEILDVE